MHYHVKVGLPAGMFSHIDDWNLLREQIRAEVDIVMRKYDDSNEMEEADMIDYGIMPEHYEDGDDKWLVNPEGIYDWYEIGGRWRLDMMPAKAHLDSWSEKFRELYVSLHTSKLHDECDVPFYLITLEEPHDMMSIDRFDIDEEDIIDKGRNFKEWLRNYDKESKYDDYIWTTVDIHN